MQLDPRLVLAGKKLGTRLNLDIHRRDLAHPARRMAAIRHHEVDLVLDVGANLGQYATALRSDGFDGRIVSFEPIPTVFAQLARRFAEDRSWAGEHCAVGRVDEPITFNVSQDTVTSSVLTPGEGLLSRIPSAAAADVLTVPCVALASVWDRVVGSSRSPMLKIDVQGFEHGVLDGLGERLSDVGLVELEMSLVNLYSGGSSIYDLLPRLHDAGFSVVSIDSGFVDQATGQVLDIDMLMSR